MLTYSDGNEALLFDSNDYMERFGRPFNQGADVVLVMNGDASANGTTSLTASYYASGNIWVNCPGAIPGRLRVNYLVVLAS